MRHYLSAAIRDLRENGALRLARKGLTVLNRDFEALRFDLRWGVSTGRSAADRKNALVSSAKENFPYEAISPRAFQETMQGIAHLRVPKLFIDMGCGKGRALLLASQYGFKHIIGVELDPNLLREAERNIKKSRIREKGDVVVEVVHCDAKDYVFPNEDAVIFYNNPFAESVMAATLQNAKRLAALKRKRCIIYQHHQNAVHESLLSNSEEYTHLVSGKNYSVYCVKG